MAIQQVLQQLANNQMNQVPVHAPEPPPPAVEPILNDLIQVVMPTNADNLAAAGRPTFSEEPTCLSGKQR